MYLHVASEVARYHIFVASLAIDFIAHGSQDYTLTDFYTKQIENEEISSTG